MIHHNYTDYKNRYCDEERCWNFFLKSKVVTLDRQCHRFAAVYGT